MQHEETMTTNVEIDCICFVLQKQYIGSVEIIQKNVNLLILPLQKIYGTHEH